MRKHSGMRPQDIAILVKVFINQDKSWLIIDAAREMHLSQSEFSESLFRSWFAGLLDDSKQRLLTNSFYEFLIYGLRFVFPQQPTRLLRGIPTAHSHEAWNYHFLYDIKFVWPYEQGEFFGLAIEPFYKNQVKAVLEDPELYFLLSIIELLRVGKTREVNFAKSELKKKLNLVR